MPTRAPPKVYQLLLKTHKLTIFLSAPQATTIASLKDDALSALTSNVNQVEDVPTVNSVNDFEICRAVKEKGRHTGTYEVLSLSDTVRNALVNWEAIFVQFKDDSGNLRPVEVSIPSLLGEDEEESQSQARPRQIEPDLSDYPSGSGKGKRKAPPE